VLADGARILIDGTLFRFRRDDVVWRDVDGEIIVLEVESGMYLNLNRSACVLWKALDEPVSVMGLVDLLVKSFGVSEAQAATDVHAFLEDLDRRSLLEQAL